MQDDNRETKITIKEHLKNLELIQKDKKCILNLCGKKATKKMSLTRDIFINVCDECFNKLLLKRKVK